MCDSEHMFECPTNAVQEQANNNQNFGFLAQFPQEHKNLVAKKFWVKKSTIPRKDNPYLQGPKLPVAAKKGYKVN